MVGVLVVKSVDKDSFPLVSFPKLEFVLMVDISESTKYTSPKYTSHFPFQTLNFVRHILH